MEQNLQKQVALKMMSKMTNLWKLARSKESEKELQVEGSWIIKVWD